MAASNTDKGVSCLLISAEAFIWTQKCGESASVFQNKTLPPDFSKYLTLLGDLGRKGIKKGMTMV